MDPKIPPVGQLFKTFPISYLTQGLWKALFPNSGPPGGQILAWGKLTLPNLGPWCKGVIWAFFWANKELPVRHNYFSRKPWVNFNFRQAKNLFPKKRGPRFQTLGLFQFFPKRGQNSWVFFSFSKRAFQGIYPLCWAPYFFGARLGTRGKAFLPFWACAQVPFLWGISTHFFPVFSPSFFSSFF